MASETSYDGLITKTTVILKSTADWDDWIFLKKDKAKQKDIWMYINPDTKADALPKLEEPARPTPHSISQGRTRLRSGLTSEQLLDLDELKEQWEHEYPIWKSKHAAINDMQYHISQTISRDLHIYIEDKDTPYERLVALKNRFALSDASRELELTSKYQALSNLKGKNLEN